MCMPSLSFPGLCQKMRRECTALHKPYHPVLDNSKKQQLLVPTESQWEWVSHCRGTPPLKHLELEQERVDLSCYRMKEVFSNN